MKNHVLFFYIYMLRVAIILPSLVNKAPIQVAKDLAGEFVLAGSEVCVYYFDDIVEVDFPCRIERISFFVAIDFKLFDVIHSHMLRPDAYVWCWRLLKPCREVGFVSTIHNIVEEDLYFSYGKLTSYIFSRLWRIFWSAQDELVVLNNAARKYYNKFLSGAKVSVIYNGRALSAVTPVDQADLNRLESLHLKFQVLGSCAVLTRRKGLDQIIRILPECRGYALVLIGDGPACVELKTLAAESGVADRCVFLGYRANAQSYLSHFDIYVMPSRSEGLPLALLEAAGNGLPVLCSDIEVFKEIFSPDEVSFFQLENNDDLVRALSFSIENKSVFSSNIKKKYKNNFTGKVMATRYLELFLDLVKRKNS